jgi:Ca-activated chloride channel family protein
VTKERIELATQKIREIKAEGGTNIYEALLAALEEYSSGEEAKSPSFILFLTDGLPTVGKITDATQILEEVNKLNKDLNIRIFTFGVGKDVNTHFLTDLAKFNHAAVSFIEPEEENIASTVGQLYSKIAYPALLDVELIFPPYLGIHDTYPKVTDLFWGSHLVIVGRYNNGGSATLIIKGKRYGADDKSPKIEEYKYNLRFSKERDREALKYLPSLWAAKKISFLMDNLRYIREKAQQDELIQEIIRLAKLYGIVTPYTSFVVIEEEEEKERMARQIMVQPLMKSTGIQAFSAMRAQEALKKRDYLVTPSKEEAEKVCYLHDKVFFLSKEGIWIDSSYTQGTPRFTLIYDSPEYYEFIAKYPEIAPYFAAGKDLIICTDIGIIKISKQS